MLGQFENLVFVIMSTRENIRLIARCSLLVQLRKTRPDITEKKCLLGSRESNQIKKKHDNTYRIYMEFKFFFLNMVPAHS